MVRPDDHRREGREGRGGIPDGLLIGILAFLLGMTLLVWSATGLAGWFARDGWPDGVTFTRTPLAMRHLIGEPHDIPGAWPETPRAQLSGYGLFWGLFIGQLMVLFVLTVFSMGTFVRWRAVRQKRRAAQAVAFEAPRPATSPAPEPMPGHHEVPTPRTAPPAPLAPEPAGLHQEAALTPEPATSPFAGETVMVGGQEKSSWPRARAARPPRPRPYGTQRARPSSSPRTRRSGRTQRTPDQNWAPSSSTTPPTSATPRPASTGPPPPAARTSRRQQREPPRSLPRSARRPSSTRPCRRQPKRSCAAICTPPRSTAAPPATSTAGPRAPRSRTRSASSVRIPRRPRAPRANSRPRSPHIPNAATWHRS